MLIKIDFRESDLHAECIQIVTMGKYKTPIKIVSENLPLGDIIVCDDDGKEHVMIERKSLNDLAASIQDGRYAEQSFRLNQCSIFNHNIYYLIEGDLRYYKAFKGLPDKKALLSAMVSISYYKGFSLFRTNTLEETAEWIVHFAQKLLKEGPSVLPFYNGGEEQLSETVSYTQVVAKRIKRDNIKPENIGEIMLSQIPSVSCAAAAAIMTNYKTIASLISALQKDSKCLNAITITNKNGLAKKLTKPCINAVYEFLLEQTIPIETNLTSKAIIT